MATLLGLCGHAISVNSIIFFDVSSYVRSGLRAMQSVFIGCSQYQQSFFPSFSIIFPRSLFIVYNFVSSGSNPFSTAHFTANTFKVLLNRLTYSYPSSFWHPGRRWCTVSLYSPHNHITFFHVLVSIICSSND